VTALTSESMGWWEAVVLGVVQGLTEFLPVSSSGHLRIVPAFLGWGDPGASFTAVTQLGTMAAVLAYFWKDLVRIAQAWVVGLTDADRRRGFDSMMGWYIVAGTIPIAILGFAFDDAIVTVARDLRLIASALILLGVLLYVVDKFGRQEREITTVTWKVALLFGLAQAAALIPGVSRSGATITMGRALGFTRGAAARFSFLLSVPAVVLSGVYEMRNIGADGSAAWGPTIVATVLAFIVGYASIAWLLRWLASHSMGVFALYRVVLGAGVLAALAAGVVTA
jgi:undecaprenyl-diphosphatase